MYRSFVFRIFRTIVFVVSVHMITGCASDQYEEAYLQAFEERASITIENIADIYPRFSDGDRPSGFDGSISDFGKYNYPKILAVFARHGENSKEAEIHNERLFIYKDLPTFHFNLVGLPRILYMFPHAAGIRGNEIDFLRQVFDRDDSFNPWTCEGTENHVGMSRTSGYLYAQYAYENYPEVFPEAEDRLAEMEKWLRYFAQRTFVTGTGEFNSESYGTYNIIGWINVYDFTNDPEIKKTAKAMLDYYAAEIALHYSQGLCGGSDMRGNRAIKSFDGSQSYLGWLWFGDSPFPACAETIDRKAGAANQFIQLIHAALSNYRPPAEIVKLAEKREDVPAMYYNSKGCYLMKDTSYIKQTFYVDSNYTLGAGYFPYGGWSSGNWQIVDWKLISRVEADSGKSAQFIAGLGTVDPSRSYIGNHRMPFDQLAQYENTLMQLTRVPENSEEIKQSVKSLYGDWEEQWKIDFYKRFPNDTDKSNPVHFQDFPVDRNQSSIVIANQGYIDFNFHDSILFIELEKSVVAVMTVGGRRPSLPVLFGKDMAWKVNTEEKKGVLCGFIIEVFNKSADAESIKEKFITQSGGILHTNLDDQLRYVNSGGDTITIRYQTAGHFTEPIYDWGYGPTEAANIQQLMDYQQPDWPEGYGHGKLAQVRVNGEPYLGYDDKWPVYSGPNILVEDGKMQITSGKSKYLIDYTTPDVRIERK